MSVIVSESYSPPKPVPRRKRVVLCWSIMMQRKNPWPRHRISKVYSDRRRRTVSNWSKPNPKWHPNRKNDDQVRSWSERRGYIWDCRLGLKDEKRKSKANRDSIASTVGKWNERFYLLAKHKIEQNSHDSLSLAMTVKFSVDHPLDFDSSRRFSRTTASNHRFNLGWVD